jgi:hypothetical protein
LDTSPLSAAKQSLTTDRDDGALPPGGSWTDPTGSLRIRHLGHGGISPQDYVDLEITHFPTLPVFELYTSATRTVQGLVGSYINGSLSSYVTQDDWRISQPISGIRVDQSLSFPSNSWGVRASVGLTNGIDANWEDYSVQWDGYLVVERAARLRLSSGDGSRMWVDLNQDSALATSGPEFIDNGWGQGQGGRISPATVTLTPGQYRIRIQYEARNGGDAYPNYFSLQSTTVGFEFFTSSNLTSAGITASFVDQSLRTYVPQDDWRVTQTISGTRIQDYPGQPNDGWGTRAAVGLTGGTDANWGLFSAQWDGWLLVHEPTVLATVSDAGSRMWIDVDGDGVFGPGPPEFVNNYWGGVDQGALFGENSTLVAPGSYQFRVQYDEAFGFNSFMVHGRATPLSAWLAFNDCSPGNGTHPDSTSYHILGQGEPTTGLLQDVRTGNQLPVTLAITHSSTGLSPSSMMGAPAVGTPLAAAFNGYVDFANAPKPGVELTNAAASVTYTFSGLNPAQRYCLRGAAVGSASGDSNRWTVCDLSGAEGFRPAHSSSRVLTTNEAPSLTGTEALLHTGGNHQPETGDYVGWEEIQSGADGSFAITCRLFTGTLPGGSPLSDRADALTDLRLEEFAGPPAPVSISVAPGGYDLLVGQSFTLTVAATGTPLSYQWYKDYLPIPQANLPTFRIAGATTNDTGRYHVVVSNQFNSVVSSVVPVGVYLDAASAAFRILPLLPSPTTNGSLPFRVTGVAAKGWVVIEASTNLLDWTPVSTNWSSRPTFDFTDDSATVNGHRFYRGAIPANQPPPPNDLPSVTLVSPLNNSSFPAGILVSVSAIAADPDGVVTRVEFFTNGVSLVTDSTAPYEYDWVTVEGSYSLQAVVTDNLGGSVTSAPSAVIITPGAPPQGTFFETNGLVVMEAEHFANSSANSEHAWLGRNDLAGYVGEMALQATPNLGTSVTANITATSPSLTYVVEFTNAGSYNLWLRGWGAGVADDSVHLGLNGQVLQTLNYNATGAWMWRSKQIVIPSPGRHEINIWMREDGAYVDRLLLTTNLVFTPTGDGPPETVLPGQNAPPGIYEWSPPPEEWPPGVPVTVAVGAPLLMFGRVEDFYGGTYTCTWNSDLAPIATQTVLAPGLDWINFTSRITYVPTVADLGERTITLTVQDNGGLTTTHVFTVTVTN